MMPQTAVSIYSRVFRLLYSRKFGGFGSKTHVIFPAGVDGARNIFLGDDVYIGYKTFLAANPLTGSSACLLKIGSGCRIGRFNHIFATRRIVLHKKVLTANNVYISDNFHGWRIPNAPIMDQPIQQIADVEIGEGTWIGHNACVLGVQIGRNCVIGANAVVTRNIPDYCVAVGVPAVIIKRYDTLTQSWRATDPHGAFALGDSSK
jgi:acetyltransferase-like isoleucine patch superfamily enzyme